VSVRGAYAAIAEALGSSTFDGIAVCSPTVFHPEQTISAVEAGVPVLLEKPPAMDLEGAQAIAAAMGRESTPVLLGYSWRWWPPLARVRALLKEKAVGELRYVHCHMSAHLADWHPWEPYQEFFMASREQGGGALLDESHWIDLMIWLFGLPKDVSAHVARLSDLEIETDDTVDALCRYERLHVSLHLDLYGRPHEKFIRFVGEDGTLTWSAEPNRIAIGHEGAQIWSEEKFDCERNDMFVGVAREFLEVVGGGAPATCTVDDGVNVMRVIDAIRQSSAAGRTVAINAGEGGL
jgi:predicted dehydrogenase